MRINDTKVYANAHFWLISLLMALITYFVFYGYGETTWLNDQGIVIGLNDSLIKISIDHLLYLLPVLYSLRIFKVRGAVIALSASLSAMLIQTFVLPNAERVLITTFITIIIGSAAIVSVFLRGRRNESLHLIEERLDIAHEKIHSKVRDAIEQEKRLAAIAAFSATLNQTIELNQVIGTAIDMVKEIMEVEVVLIFSLDKDANELRVTAFEGVDERYVSAVDKMKLGEGFCGRVAKTGRPLVIEDPSSELSPKSPDAKSEKLMAQLSVPLRTRGRIIGTLCAATRQPRRFSHAEVELLSAIGNLIGIAMENSRLNREREVAIDNLKVSEKKYRKLFENAHDAIWVQDLSGNITAANQAAAHLFGCTLRELVGSNINRFQVQETLEHSQDIQQGLLKGWGKQSPYTQRFVKMDSTEAILMLTTNLISMNGHPDGLQFIGRDITKEVRMQENQSFYLQQITQAHEDERQRISRDLHDSTAQNLIGVLHKLEDFCQTDEYLPMTKLRSLWSFHERLKESLQEIRQLSRDLRPSILDHLGLLPAVDWLAEQLKTEHKIKATLAVSGVQQRFSPEIEVTLFRIVQEALRNVARHSEATQACISIAFDTNETRVMISDNGKGVELPDSTGELSRHGKLGIDGMQTRARLIGGTFNVESNPGIGTTITVVIPSQ